MSASNQIQSNGRERCRASSPDARGKRRGKNAVITRRGLHVSSCIRKVRAGLNCTNISGFDRPFHLGAVLPHIADGLFVDFCDRHAEVTHRGHFKVSSTPIKNHGVPIAALMAYEVPQIGLANRVSGNQARLLLGGFYGVTMGFLYALGLACHELAPKAFKRHVAGNGNASKSDVMKAVRQLGHESAKTDQTDAVVILLTSQAQLEEKAAA